MTSEQLSNKHKDKTEKDINFFFGFWFVVTGMLICIDQITKWFAGKYAHTLFLNNKFAFSLPVPVAVMYLIYTAVVIFVTAHLYTSWNNIPAVSKLGWCCIIAGGVSNIGERVVLGYVRDFIPFLNGILNVADIFIVIGLFIILVTYRSQKTLA